MNLTTYQLPVAAIVLATGLLAACSKAPDKAVSTGSETAPPVSPTELVARTSPLDDIAAAEAKRCFASVCLVEGDSWVTAVDGPGHDWWEEFKNPRFTVTRSNTAADTLNGYEYRGTVRISATALRTTTTLIGDPIVWQEWMNGVGQDTYEFNIAKRNGTWSCSGRRLENWSKPKLSEMPPRPK